MFTVSTNLLSKSGLNVAQINKLLSGHGKLDCLGQAFIDVENKFGVNAFWGMAQAIQETGWGTSVIARDFNNLFGITAYDTNPYGNASHYNSPSACVEYWGGFIKKQYLTPGGVYYISCTPAGVARHWASDPYYATEVVGIMNLLFARMPVVTKPKPLPPPKAPVYYSVKSGQNMSIIARLEGLTLSQLESMNPSAGHPAGNFNVIWPNDRLRIK